MRSFVTILFATLVPWVYLSRSDSLIGPTSLIGRIQIRASKVNSNRGHADDAAEKLSCRKFVGDFYSWYLAHSKHQAPLQAALKKKRANFSPDLVRSLDEDLAAAARSPGEIVGLEFDPVLNSQDFAEKYIPGKVTQNGRRFFVEVVSVYDGKKSAGPAVTPELRREGSRWVFTNFLYKHDGKSDDLLSILKQLKADRKKHS